MVLIDEAPEHILSFIKHKGFNASEYIVACKGDLNSKGGFEDFWTLVTKDRFFIVSENLEYFSSYELNEVSEFNSESLVSTGLLTAKLKRNNEFVDICRYTNTYLRKFSLFVKIANKVINNEEIRDDDIDFSLVNNYCEKCGALLQDPSMKICYKCVDKKSVFRRLLTYSKSYRRQLGQIVVLIILNSLLAMVGPYLTGTVFFDEVIGGEENFFGIKLFQNIALFVAIMVAYKIITSIVSTFYGKLIAKVSAEVVYDLKIDIFDSMQSLSMRFFTSKQTGSLMTRVNSDTQDVLYFFIDGLPFLISNTLNIVAVTAFLLSMNPKLTIGVYWPVPLIFIFFRVFLPKFNKMHGKVHRKRSKMNAGMNDSFSGLKVVKAFGKEDDEIAKFNYNSEGYKDTSVDVDKSSSTIFPFVNQTMWFSSILIYIFGGLMILNGMTTLGTIMTYLGYLSLIYGPISNIAMKLVDWANAMNSANRIFEIIDAIPEITNVENPVRLPHIKGDIEMKHVSFSYEVNKSVLHDVSVNVKSGEMIGLVGHSGAGKSTITNLITRLYDVTEGEITIDGYPIKEIDIKDLRSQIGMVLQDTYLFIGSIAQNIAYAKPDASLDDIVTVSKAANCHDFITKLPDGYDTIVGVGGHGLSGGEKQRISIARALLHNPRILILDEATSAVDTETERQISEALQRLVKGRTTFAIAHRLSTLKDADRLMVIEKGRLVELGTHEEVYNMKGIYYDLYQKQQEALKLRGVD